MRSMQEIKAAIDFFKGKSICFTSDTFGVNVKWMTELFSEMRKITNLPFTLLLRPEYATEEVISLLAKYDCYSVALGVESGSPRVRQEVLNRKYSDDLLLKVAANLHKYNILFRTYNIIGLPGETEAELWETVDLNIKMKADFPIAAIFTPFPGTRIVKYAIGKRLLDEDFTYDSIPNSILETSILQHVNTGKIKNFLYFFQTMVIYPKSRSFLKKLINLKTNIFFKLWFYIIYAYLHKKSEKRSFWNYVVYIAANRKNL
jgi:radical SAM superfamily enzyme YgiQ (UPF0313 family)